MFIEKYFLCYLKALFLFFSHIYINKLTYYLQVYVNPDVHIFVLMRVEG